MNHWSKSLLFLSRIYRLGEVGLLDYWYRKNIPKQRCFDTETYAQQPVRLGDLTLLIEFVLVLGGGLSLCVFIIELVLGCGMKCRQCCRNKEPLDEIPPDEPLDKDSEQI